MVKLPSLGEAGRLIVLISGIWILGSVFMQPGLFNKVAVIILVGMLYMMYQRIQSSQKSYDAVVDYYLQLRTECKRKGASGLKGLKMLGDAANGWYYKGKIVGGPTFRSSKALSKDDPRKVLMVFLYTSDTGWMFTAPVISWIMGNYRKEYLFGVFHNPNAKESQLVSPLKMDSENPHDRHYKFYGDVEVRGITTIIHGSQNDYMEFVNDDFFDPNIENSRLKKSVYNLTLTNHLRSLPEIVDNALKSNSIHQRSMEMKDEVGGFAKAEGK